MLSDKKGSFVHLHLTLYQRHEPVQWSGTQPLTKTLFINGFFIEQKLNLGSVLACSTLIWYTVSDGAVVWVS